MLRIAFAPVRAAVAVREAAGKQQTLVQPHGLRLSDGARVSQGFNPETQEMKALAGMRLSWEPLGDSFVNPLSALSYVLS